MRIRSPKAASLMAPEYLDLDYQDIVLAVQAEAWLKRASAEEFAQLASLLPEFGADEATRICLAGAESAQKEAAVRRLQSAHNHNDFKDVGFKGNPSGWMRDEDEEDEEDEDSPFGEFNQMAVEGIDDDDDDADIERTLKLFDNPFYDPNDEIDDTPDLW